MDDGTHPTPTTRPTIHSASDEAAASAEASKRPNIRPSIRSASEEQAPKAGAAAAQASRGLLGQQPRPWPPKLSGSGSMGGFPDAGRATESGNAPAAIYGGGLAEAVTFMNQAVERQNEMMSSMLRAHGPQDIMMAGSRYLLGGWLAFFEVNVRIAQAASRMTEGAKQMTPRPEA
ncbi:hypothetical protein HUE56_00200 (plasmid) [Azospirillum oryzae]|uniref:Phasin protein n=1 Tax=Azospirillum oryzae TaxID=286727 RepID=A0A6N1ABN2_9PROT|nr:hypothetical protein [Azospirillum oryzae]KAA0586747.1 hypothetical protein FZ938_21415 [Azospirillum oryzae]QKS48973.1 hypothetical protein HUE56_00200 [Azospirillum oryzae]GLR82996.1 hypothetical protein GCM10007856_57040 [Azospirillum oryzae]